MKGRVCSSLKTLRNSKNFTLALHVLSILFLCFAPKFCIPIKIVDLVKDLEIALFWGVTKVIWKHSWLPTDTCAKATRLHFVKFVHKICLELKIFAKVIYLLFCIQNEVLNTISFLKKLHSLMYQKGDFKSLFESLPTLVKSNLHTH